LGCTAFFNKESQMLRFHKMNASNFTTVSVIMLNSVTISNSNNFANSSNGTNSSSGLSGNLSSKLGMKQIVLED